MASGLFPRLDAYLVERLSELDRIDDARRAELGLMADAVARRISAGRPARLVFICTHNSRRSQMAQLWAQVAARIFSVPGVETYSGGSEATAFNPRAAAALKRAGFAIEVFHEGKNPVREVRYEREMEPIRAFSKVYDRPPNPTGDFVAVMTCSAADGACPVIAGAVDRVAIPYDDPKAADGTDRETEVYDERCAEIAREMLYVFSEVARRA